MSIEAMQKKIEEMLAMQDRLNYRIDPNWRNRRDFDWLRAVWTECAEAMDKVGWKWWKKQTPDNAQLKLELVDIWHFLLSESIVIKAKSSYLAGCFDYEPEDDDQLLTLEAITMAALSRDFRSCFVGFIEASKQAGMSFDDLFEQYAAKYVLNEFRWDNGYQDGSYRKIWADGREDNEHLVEIAAQWSGSSEFAIQVYQGLLLRYPQQGAVML